MPRTRSSIARAAPKPHKLPTDILTRVAAFTCDDELARLALSAKSALTALDNQQIWAATLRTNHGGLRIDTSRESGLLAAKCLSEARKNRGPVYGCHALASDVTSYGGGPVWVDGMFQPEPWRVYYSAMGNGRALCAATFLTGGTYDPDRQWMIDTLREAHSSYYLETSYENLPATLADVFLREFGGHWAGAPEYMLDDHERRIKQKCREIEDRFAAGEPRERTGLDATVFEERDDGVEVDARVEALCGGARQATVVATGIVIRRPSGNATCPGRLFMLFGCRRPPRASDLAGARQLAVGATPGCRNLVENPCRGSLWVSQSELGVTMASHLRSNLEKTEGCAFQFLGSDEEIFPLAICGFQHVLDRDITDLRATLSKPVAIQGLVVAILEVDNEDPNLGVNVDMEYVGVEGYTYE